MKSKIIALLFMSAVSFNVLAEKPEWAGQGKPTDEQKAAHVSAMKAKGEEPSQATGQQADVSTDKAKMEKTSVDASSDPGKNSENQKAATEEQKTEAEQKAEKEAKDESERTQKAKEAAQQAKKWWEIFQD